MTAILLAAGYGTRVRSLFPDTPKALIRADPGRRARAARPPARQPLPLRRRRACALVTNDRFLPAFERHLAAHDAPLPVHLFSDGTAHERRRLGALGDLALTLDRLAITDTSLVAATDNLPAFELAEPLAFASRRAATVNVCVRMPNRSHITGRHGCVLLDADGSYLDRAEIGRDPHLSGVDFRSPRLPPAAAAGRSP